MIDKEVAISIGRFLDYWGKISPDQLRYKLDGTWPSVALIDLILSPLEGFAELDDFQIELINGAAGYLGVILESCWSIYLEQPTIHIFADPTSALCVTVCIGEKNESTNSFDFKINLSESIAQIVRSPESPFPYFHTTARHLPRRYNRINLFATGLAAGLSPYAEGEWSSSERIQTLERTIFADIALCDTTTNHYQRLYPSEPVGAHIELYQCSLILPPPGHIEKFAFMRSTTMTLKRISSKTNGNHIAIAGVAKNLMLLADDSISKTGFCILAALDLTEFKKNVLSFSESIAEALPALRPAFTMARSILEKPNDYLYLSKLFHEEEKPEQLLDAIEQAKLEQELGFLPFVRLDFSLLEHTTLLPVFYNLTFVNITAAIDDLTILVAKNLALPELKSQLAFLEYLQGNLVEASKILESLPDSQSATYWEVRGALAAKEHALLEAVSFFKNALALEPPSFQRKQILKQLALCLESLKEFDEAIKIIANENKTLNSFALKIKYIQLCYLQGDKKTAAALLRELRYLAPYDRDIFPLHFLL